MSGGVALQALISGVSIGVVYGIVALGFTLVYRLTRVFAFAHGDLVVGGVFLGVLTVVGRTPVARLLSLPDSVALAVVIPLIGAALSVAIYVVAVRPFLVGTTSGQPLGWVAGGIAAALVLREVLGLLFTQQAYAVPDPLHLSALTSSGVVSLPGDVTIPVRTFGVLGVGVIVAAAVEFMVVRSRVGLALRATSDDAEMAALLGVPVQRVVFAAFALAGLLAGIAGLLQAPEQSLSVDAGVILGLKAIAAALVGGLGSPRGALVGGLVVGLAEQYAVAWPHLGAAYADVVPLAILLVVIAVRPEGLRRRAAEPVL